MGITTSGLTSGDANELNLSTSASGWAANSAQVNTAMAAGRNVSITSPGTYYFDSIVLQPGVEFYTAPNVTIKQTVGISQTRLLTNNAFQNGVSVTVSSLTYDAVTGFCTCTTSAAHGLVAGDFANVSWANEVGYNGNFLVTDTPSTTQFKYIPYERPTAATATLFNLPLTFTMTAATKANPCQITINHVSTTNPFTENMYFSFSGVGGMTELNGQKYGIIPGSKGGVSGAWTAQIGNRATGVGLNSTAFGTYTSGGTMTLVTRPIANVGMNIYPSDVNTIMVRKCDTNIRVRIEGIIDQSNNSSYGDPYSSACLLAFVQGGEATIYNAINIKGWILYSSGIGNFTVIEANSNYNGLPIGSVQNVGWCRGLTYKKVAISNVIDNVVTFSTYDGSPYVWAAGITCGECDFRVDEAYSDAKTGADVGTPNIPPLLLFGASQFPINASYGKVRCSQAVSTTLGLQVSGGSVDDLNGCWIRKLEMNDAHFVGSGIIYSASLGSRLDYVDLGLTVEGANLQAAVTTGTTGANTVIDVLNFTVNYLSPEAFSGNAGYSLVNMGGGQIRTLNLKGSGRLTSNIGNPLVYSAAKVGTINYHQCSFENFTKWYDETSAASNISSPSIKHLAVNFLGCHITGIVSINNAAARSVNFVGGNTLAPTNKLIKKLLGGQLIVTSGGNNWSQMAVSQFLDQASVGGNTYVYGADIFCDPAVLTTGGSPSGAGVLIIPKTSAGQMCRSGNAGVAMAGSATCNGANWYALATGAAGVNTLII